MAPPSKDTVMETPWYIVLKSEYRTNRLEPGDEGRNQAMWTPSGNK